MKKCFYEKCSGNGTLNIKAAACTVGQTDCSLNTEPLEPQTTVFCTVTHWYTEKFPPAICNIFFHETAI